jgi:predicted ATPase
MMTGAGVNRLIGREHEVEELVTALDDALAGNGGLVMLVGEPGIGKTRLTQELISTASDCGAMTAVGACYEGGTTPPYWAWTQAIRSLLIDPVDAVLNALEPRAAVIVESIPEISDMFPDIAPPTAVDPGKPAFDSSIRLRHFLKKLPSINRS